MIDDRADRETPSFFPDREIRRLGLTDAQKAALAAFLKTLTVKVREGLQP